MSNVSTTIGWILANSLAHKIEAHLALFADEHIGGVWEGGHRDTGKMPLEAAAQERTRIRIKFSIDAADAPYREMKAKGEQEMTAHFGYVGRMPTFIISDKWPINPFADIAILKDENGEGEADREHLLARIDELQGQLAAEKESRRGWQERAARAEEIACRGDGEGEPDCEEAP